VLNALTLNMPNIFTRDHSDPVWKGVRKAVARVFTQSNLARHFPAVLEHVNALADNQWAPAAASGEPLEFVHCIKTLMVHMLGVVGFELDLAAPEVRLGCQTGRECARQQADRLAARRGGCRWTTRWRS